LAGYFLGSIPFGYLIARRAGSGDIRSAGSGNVGATNVARIAGIGAGILTMILDAGKGALAVWIAMLATHHSAAWMVAATLGAILGHVYPVWLAGRGGRGVSTAAGGFLLICWPAVAAAIFIWLVVLAATRYVSLASILAAASLPFLTYILYAPGRAPAHVISMGMALGSLIIILKHQPNVARLITGTESKLNLRHRSSPDEN